MPEDLVLRIARLKIERDEILVVKSDRVLTGDQVSDIKEYLKVAVGVDLRVLVLGPNLALSVLTRAEIEAAAR